MGASSNCPRHAYYIDVGQPQSIKVPCQPIKDPTWQNRNYYNAFCPLNLAGMPTTEQAFRVCTGKTYVESKSNMYGGVYAASLLDLVINKSALTYAKPSPYDYNFSPITTQVCHDVFDTAEAWFMVGPGASGGYWDAANVSAIDVTVQTLKWATGTAIGDR